MSRTPSAGDDAALFNRFLAGEDEAFLLLFRQYNQRLHTYCVKIVGCQEAAEDVTQELWERVIGLRARPQEVRNPGGFFLKIARNLCLDYLKRGRRTVPLDDIDETNYPVQDRQELSDLEEIAVASLDGLPFEYREVLVLNLYCGYRFDEIAVMMGKSPDAVWAQASRARARLRRIVAKQLESGGLGHPNTRHPRSNRTTEEHDNDE